MEDLMFELNPEPSFRPYFCIFWPAVFPGWEEGFVLDEGPGVAIGSGLIGLLLGKGGGAGCEGLDPSDGPGAAGGNGAGAARADFGVL